MKSSLITQVWSFDHHHITMAFGSPGSRLQRAGQLSHVQHPVPSGIVALKGLGETLGDVCSGDSGNHLGKISGAKIEIWGKYQKIGENIGKFWGNHRGGLGNIRKMLEFFGTCSLIKWYKMWIYIYNIWDHEDADVWKRAITIEPMSEILDTPPIMLQTHSTTSIWWKGFWFCSHEIVVPQKMECISLEKT